MRKLLSFTLAAGMCASLCAENIKFLTFGLGLPGSDEPEMIGLGISPNGQYVCGPIGYGDGYFVGDLKTDEYVYGWTDDDEGAELRSVDNNGLAIGYDGPGITVDITGKRSVLELPGFNGYILGEGITNDGSIMIGSLVAGAGFIANAAYSRDGGEWTQLPLPEMTYGYQGSAAKYVSGDGKVIVGFIGSYGPATLWVMNDAGDYECDLLYEKYVVMTDDDMDDEDKIFRALRPCNISNNGEYVLLRGVKKGSQAAIPVIYNTITKKFTLYDEPQEVDVKGTGLLPSAIADDGTFIGIIGSTALYDCYGTFILKAGETQAISFTEAFPNYVDDFKVADMIGFNVLTDISANGQYILGYYYYADDYYSDTSDAYFRTYVIDTKGESGVDKISAENANATVEAIYSIDGKRIDAPRKGLNIIRMSDGSVKKVIK